MAKDQYDTETVERPTVGARQWAGVAVLTLPAVLIAVDFTVLHLAVPHVGAALDASATEMLWVVDIYGFMVAGLLIAMGTLGDRIGRRRVLLVGAAAFAAASVLAATSSSPEMLIAARALLGVAGATLLPSTVSLISNMFPDERQRRLAIAVWATSFALGGAAGPLAGGALLEHYDWGVIFLLAVPVMLVLLLGAPLLVPEYRDPAGGGRVDLPSVALSMLSIIAIVYGIKQLAKGGLEGVPLLAIGAGLAGGLAFVRRQRRLASPLLDLRMFANRAFAVPLGALTTGLFVLAAITFLLMQHLQLVLGLSPLEAGLWTVPAMAAGVAGSLLAPAAAGAVGPVRAITAGLAIGSAGLLLITQADGLALIVIGFSVVNLGVNAVAVLAYDSILSSSPPERAGAASGTAETGNELGIALGIAIAGSLASAAYRGQLEGDSLPAGLGATEVTAARDSLTGAVEVADALPDRLAATVLEVSRTAFTEAVQLTSVLLAVVLAGLAITVAILLRPAPAGAHAAAAAAGEDRESSAPAS